MCQMNKEQIELKIYDKASENKSASPVFHTCVFLDSEPFALRDWYIWWSVKAAFFFWTQGQSRLQVPVLLNTVVWGLPSFKCPDSEERVVMASEGHRVPYRFRLPQDWSTVMSLPLCCEHFHWEHHENVCLVPTNEGSWHKRREGICTNQCETKDLK